MTDRIPLDHLTSDQYDELCARLDMAEAELAEVRALRDRWVKAGPPPLGTSMSRWWDRRLVELGAALRSGEQPGPG